MRLLPIIISLSFSPQAFSSDWLELNNLPNSTEYPTWVQSAYSDVGVSIAFNIRFTHQPK